MYKQAARLHLERSFIEDYTWIAVANISCPRSSSCNILKLGQQWQDATSRKLAIQSACQQRCAMSCV